MECMHTRPIEGPCPECGDPPTPAGSIPPRPRPVLEAVLILATIAVLSAAAWLALQAGQPS